MIIIGIHQNLLKSEFQNLNESNHKVANQISG